MLRFFRQIRKTLMEQNKIRTYLLYALGEILLVVIGILIALQVNNWNTESQALKLEMRVLKELNNGLEKDKELLVTTLEKYRSDHKELLTLDSLLKIPDYSYSEDLHPLFGAVYGIRYVRLNQAFYEDLKSNGLHLIQDENIRSEIVNLFENKYKLLDTYLSNERSVNQIIRPYYIENFTELDFHDSASPSDYGKIWKDPVFKNLLHYRIVSLEANQLTEYLNTINLIEALTDKIDFYLR